MGTIFNAQKNPHTPTQLPATTGGAAPTATAVDASTGERLGKQLTFEVLGEGVLPRVSIVRPTIRTRSGQPLLLYKKLLTERTQTLPFALYNDGTLSCTVSLTQRSQISWLSAI